MLPHKPKLLDQVRALMRLRHMSHKTERASTSYIRDYILFHNKRHPSEMGVEEIRSHLTHLAVDKNVAASTQNVAFNALLFLYKQVLSAELPAIEGVFRARRPARLPSAFTRRLENSRREHKIRGTVFRYRLQELVYPINVSGDPTNAH